MISTLALVAMCGVMVFLNRHDSNTWIGWLAAAFAYIALFFNEWRLKMRDEIIEAQCPEYSLKK